MHNYRYRYSLFGIPVSRPVYRRLGRFTPEWFRGVRSVPAGD